MQKRILMIDDSATIRKLLARALDGFELHQAPSGEAGVALASEVHCDLVIVDVNMPGMSGIEVVSALRQTEAYGRVPIFVMTTESTDDLVAAGKEAGATAWIIKPFHAAILRRLVTKALGEPSGLGDETPSSS